MVLFSLLVISFGFFLFLSPASVIEAQRKLYACFNWRLEPISVPKAIRSIKFTGLFLIILTLSTLGWLIKAK